MAAYFLGLRVRIPLQACKSVSLDCCMLSGRGLCDGPITRPEESPTECGVSQCDRKATEKEEALAH